MELQRQTNSTLTKGAAMPDLLRLLSSSDPSVSLGVKAGALVRQQKDLTPQRALQAPKLSSLKRQDPATTAEAVASLIYVTSQQFNVKRNLSGLQLELLTAQILQKWYFLSFDELSYVMREALSHRWGPVYDHLDGPMILEWVNQYCEQERAATVADNLERERSQGTQALSKVELAVLGYNVGELSPEELQRGRELWERAQAAKFEQDKAVTENLHGKKRQVEREPETPELLERVRAGLETQQPEPGLALQYADYYERRGQLKAAALCRDHANKNSI